MIKIISANQKLPHDCVGVGFHVYSLCFACLSMLFSLPFLNQIPLLPFYEEAVYRSKISSLLLSLINLSQNTFHCLLGTLGFLNAGMWMDSANGNFEACISREGHMYLL